MYEKFNNNFQNIQPEEDPNINPYQQRFFGENNQAPYIENMTVPVPGALDQNNFYPLEPSLANPSLATQIQPNTLARNNYANGGKVKRGKRIQRNSLPSLAEMIRQQGEGDDMILAHIHPDEARMLEEQFGGDINPVTGLPQFGLFRNPGKWLKGSIGGAGGAILGNMILPGIGGVIGGALGGAAGSAARGRKDYLSAGIRGAGMGAALPSVASIAGSGASALGMNSAGSTLSNYGAKNAIFPSLGKLIGDNAVGNYVGSIGQGSSALSNSTNALSHAITGTGGSGSKTPTISATAGNSPVGGEAEKSFLDTLTGKSKDFLTDPKNLLTLGVVGSSFLNRPKEKSPEKLAEEQKRYNRALLLSPEERAQKEAADLGEVQSKRRIERNKFLPEERLKLDPIHRKTHTPEEYEKNKRWFNYYDNPQFTGTPLNYKKGGLVPGMECEAIETEYPKGLGYFVKGETGGQDDKIKAMLSDGEYVIPADVVSHAGDGNNEAGAKKFDAFLKNIRKHKGGSIKLPPKVKSLASYMR